MKPLMPPPQRRQPLPKQRPKPSSDDAEAPARIKALVESPTYRAADHDPDFLARADMRGTRLLLDYAKPQQLLVEADVAHTMVVFDSTRIPVSGVAQRNCDALGAALAARPDDSALHRRFDIAQRVLAKTRYYDMAREFGRL
jgi:hypothetical protein